MNKILPLQLVKLHFTWYGSFIVYAWTGTNTYTCNISPGSTGSSERYHKQCPEAHGWRAFLSSPWSHCLSAASGKWDRIHEDQRYEKDGWDSINVLPCFHKDSAYEGKKDCFLTLTLQEKKTEKHMPFYTHKKGEWILKNVKAHYFVKAEKFKSLCYIDYIIKNKTDTYQSHADLPQGSTFHLSSFVWDFK